MTRWLAGLLIAGLLAGSGLVGPAHGQSAELTLDGAGITAQGWSLAQFRQLPRTTVKVRNAAGNEDGYEGVDLSVLLAAGAFR